MCIAISAAETTSVISYSDETQYWVIGKCAAMIFSMNVNTNKLNSLQEMESSSNMTLEILCMVIIL
jgi:hypothetical protein